MLRVLTHGIALTALFYAWRSPYVPLVESGADVPSLSIVVPARDGERSIERCVRSLVAQSGVKAEVIIVDDGSTDATPPSLRVLLRKFRNCWSSPAKRCRRAGR
jgi:cellulose synthase/poly-beta-1,6-N-acetylglucosamine synthase-like glycosyltransferase